MKVKGFINIYPGNEPEAKGLDKNGLKTGNGIFLTKEFADRSALPSRLAVAEFEYTKNSYKNLYKGRPWGDITDHAITIGAGEYASENAAREAVGESPWKPHHIGVVLLND